MPSPFPGMDPYLENTDFWPGFHNGFMHYAQEMLQPRLPKGYNATLEMRVYFEPDPDLRVRRQQRVPDLQLVRTKPVPLAAGARRSDTGVMLELNPVEVREAYLSVKELPSGRVVTSVELLSPSNKAPGVGRDDYLHKQWKLYGAGANLVEIDLLRGGLNSVLVLPERLAALPPFHYLTGVYRASDPMLYEAITWSLRDLMPSLPIPLDPGVEEVRLELGEIFTRTFATAAFEDALGYGGDAKPPLTGDDAEWADALLRAAGSRDQPNA